MKTIIVLLAMALSACAPASGSAPATSDALSCTQLEASAAVLYPDGVTRHSVVESCSDGCDHDTPVDGNGPKMSICAQFQNGPIR